MSESPNPYASTTSPIATRSLAADTLAAQSACSLARWQRFFSVMLLISLGLILMGTLFPVFSGGNGVAGGQLLLFVVVCSVSIFVYLIPAIKLWKAANAVSEFGLSDRVSLEEVLALQASFWRYIGILTVIVLMLYAVALFFSIIV